MRYFRGAAFGFLLAAVYAALLICYGAAPATLPLARKNTHPFQHLAQPQDVTGRKKYQPPRPDGREQTPATMAEREVIKTGQQVGAP